jgi:hypothetical protein
MPMDKTKTTWFGATGEALKVGAGFVPPPYNLIPMGVGAMLSAMGFFFAEDRKVTAEVTDASETPGPPKA